ncbi:hypothetical protein LIPSTDRAFT_30041 [Lipomyces starkeyi NRRL Y-11557]|uniref:Uncharacterized protein n=1 Tax=Lipomyces starkeyi NRRL Y-11557 TaxID=675824 RepID=A0A1E3PX84_LIPST|nr:hypothetical protein LIPSTDRAFT_30041 [Lipomyces starkeyi NRRL Y-11557]
MRSQFKPWLDLPPPRHELHDDSSSDEDQHFESEDEDDEFKPQNPPRQDPGSSIQINVLISDSVKQLVIASPSLEATLLALGDSTQCGSISVLSSSFDQTVPIMYLNRHNFHWIKLPQIPPNLCYPLAQALFEDLRPDVTVVLVPLFVDPDRPVRVLATSELKLDISDDLVLQPPHFITGIFAAIMSYVGSRFAVYMLRDDTNTYSKAEIIHSKAIALVTNAEGVPDHEFVEEEASEDLVQLLPKIIQSTEDWKIDLFTLRRFHVRSTAMYL